MPISWNLPSLPLTAPAGIASTRCLGGRVCTDEVCGRKKDGDEDYHQQTPHEYVPPLVVPAFQLVVLAPCRICDRPITLHIALHVSPCIGTASLSGLAPETSSSTILPPCCLKRPSVRARTGCGR